MTDYEDSKKFASPLEENVQKVRKVWLEKEFETKQYRVLSAKRHIATKKCHNPIKKCHAMTSCGCKSTQKMQGQSAGYVKVMFFALPLKLVEN